jgi:hypothetical protein
VTDETPPETLPEILPGTLPGEGPTVKIESSVEVPEPVFVDDSGKRGKRIRMAFYALGGLGLTYAALVAVSLAGGPLNPESLIPFPEKFVKPATTPAVRPVGNAAQGRAKNPRLTGTPRPGDRNTPQPANPANPGIAVAPGGPTPTPTPSTSKPVEGASEPGTPPPPTTLPVSPPASPPQSPAQEAGPVATDNPTVAVPPQTTNAPAPVDTTTVAAPAGPADPTAAAPPAEPVKTTGAAELPKPAGDATSAPVYAPGSAT